MDNKTVIIVAILVLLTLASLAEAKKSKRVNEHNNQLKQRQSRKEFNSQKSQFIDEEEHISCSCSCSTLVNQKVKEVALNKGGKSCKGKHCKGLPKIKSLEEVQEQLTSDKKQAK